MCRMTVGSSLCRGRRFEAEKVMAVIQGDNVTVCPGVPTMFFALLHHPSAGKYDLSSLRIAVSGGAAIPGEVIQAFEGKFKTTILEGYGLSETSPTATFNFSAAERKVLSIGKPIFVVEIRIFNLDQNHLPTVNTPSLQLP